MNPQTLARVTGVLFLVTYITSIPAFFVFYAPILKDPGYITGAGPDTSVLLGAFLELLLIIRILLLALGANSGNALVDGIYNISDPFVAPFIGVFNINHVHPMGSSVIDVAAIVAMVGYAVLALIIDAILRIADRRYAA